MTSDAPTVSDTFQKVGRIRAVCLDIDETLVDYVTSSRMALIALMGHDDAWASWSRLTDAHYDRYIAGEVDFDTMRWERTRQFFMDHGEVLDDAEVIDRERRRQNALRDAWCLFEDAIPCVEWIRSSGLRLAAVTNAAGRYQRGKLAALGLTDLFDKIVISGEIGAAKPDPVIFHSACVALGVAPHEAVHVGDRLDLDAVGAHDAGMYGVWLDRFSRRTCPRRGNPGPVPEGISVIGSLSELPALLAGRSHNDVPAVRR